MPQSEKIKGVIFDFDGVIVDSEMHWMNVENPYLSRHIPTWNSKYYGLLIGKSLPEVHDFLSAKFSFRLSKAQYFSDYEKMALSLYRDRASELPGFRALLEHLIRNNIKVAIASSSRREWIDLALQSNGLSVYFKTIVSAYDANILKGKPFPDVYLEAAKLLREVPQRLIAIEDSSNGVRAARAAEVFCFGLRNGANDDQDLSAANEIIEGYNATFLRNLKG